MFSVRLLIITCALSLAGVMGIKWIPFVIAPAWGDEIAAAPHVNEAPPSENTDNDDMAQAARRRDRLLWRPLTLSREMAQSPLAAMALSDDPQSRMRALEGLAGSGNAEFVPFAIASLADPNEEVRERALETLYHVDPKAVTDAVTAVLAWGQAPVVAAVNDVLPSLRSVLEPGMLQMLDAPDTTRDERVAVAYGLGRIGSRRAVEPLAEKVWGDDPVLSVYAANAIAAIDDPGALPTLINMVRHTDPNVRVPAYYAIARIGGPEALGLLTDAASPNGDPDRRVKREVIRDLGLAGDVSTVHFLIGLVRARSGFVQPAIEALEVITGMPHGLQRERWLEWYDDTFGNQTQEVTAPAPPLVPIQERTPIPGVPPGGLPIIPSGANGS